MSVTERIVRPAVADASKMERAEAGRTHAVKLGDSLRRLGGEAQGR